MSVRLSLFTTSSTTTTYSATAAGVSSSVASGMSSGGSGVSKVSSRPSKPMLANRFAKPGVFSFMGGEVVGALLLGGEGGAAGGDGVYGGDVSWS